MSIFEKLMQESGGLDLAAIGAKVGLTPEQVQTGASQLIPKIADPKVDNQQATAQVAGDTEIPHSKLQALLPVLLAEAQKSGAGGTALSSILSGLGGAGAGAGGMLSELSGALGSGSGNMN
jgi:hypothetical protein